MHKIAHMTAAILATAACSAQAADVIDLWPEGAPNKSTITAAEETNAQGSIFNVTRARLEVSAPANPNGKAVIVIPGGGYGNLSMSTIERASFRSSTHRALRRSCSNIVFRRATRKCRSQMPTRPLKPFARSSANTTCTPSA